MPMAEGWGSSTPEWEDLSIGLFEEKSQEQNPKLHGAPPASPQKPDGLLQTVSRGYQYHFMDGYSMTYLRQKRTQKACKSAVLFKSQDFS